MLAKQFQSSRYLLIALMLSGCQGSHRMETPQTLYQQVGGADGVARVVDGLLSRVHDDARLNGLFENTDLDDLRRLVNEQLCQAMGGPCVYSGRSMEDAHSGLNINDQEFDWFVAHLIESMRAASLTEKQQTAILNLLGPMRPQVVGQ